MPNGLAEGFFQGVQLHPRHRPRRRLAVAYTEDASGRLEFGRGTLPPYERARGRRNLPVSAPPAPDAPPTIGTTFRRRDRSVNMAKSRQAVPNATIPEDRQNYDYRHTVPLRTHPAPLVRQQAVERRFGERKRNRRFRDGTSPTERDYNPRYSARL